MEISHRKRYGETFFFQINVICFFIFTSVFLVFFYDLIFFFFVKVKEGTLLDDVGFHVTSLATKVLLFSILFFY